MLGSSFKMLKAPGNTEESLEIMESCLKYWRVAVSAQIQCHSESNRCPLVVVQRHVH